jgi:hypothetical protein
LTLTGHLYFLRNAGSAQYDGHSTAAAAAAPSSNAGWPEGWCHVHGTPPTATAPPTAAATTAKQEKVSDRQEEVEESKIELLAPVTTTLCFAGCTQLYASLPKFGVLPLVSIQVTL